MSEPPSFCPFFLPRCPPTGACKEKSAGTRSADAGRTPGGRVERNWRRRPAALTTLVFSSLLLAVFVAVVISRFRDPVPLAKHKIFRGPAGRTLTLPSRGRMCSLTSRDRSVALSCARLR